MENGRVQDRSIDPKDQATVLIDTTGSSLFKRGYRTGKGAPIKEIWQQQFFCCQTGIQISP